MGFEGWGGGLRGTGQAVDPERWTQAGGCTKQAREGGEGRTFPAKGNIGLINRCRVGIFGSALLERPDLRLKGCTKQGKDKADWCRERTWFVIGLANPISQGGSALSVPTRPMPMRCYALRRALESDSGAGFECSPRKTQWGTGCSRHHEGVDCSGERRAAICRTQGPEQVRAAQPDSGGRQETYQIRRTSWGKRGFFPKRQGLDFYILT